jgi:hypothetical protein
MLAFFLRHPAPSRALTFALTEAQCSKARFTILSRGGRMERAPKDGCPNYPFWDLSGLSTRCAVASTICFLFPPRRCVPLHLHVSRHFSVSSHLAFMQNKISYHVFCVCVNQFAGDQIFVALSLYLFCGLALPNLICLSDFDSRQRFCSSRYDHSLLDNFSIRLAPEMKYDFLFCACL